VVTNISCKIKKRQFGEETFQAKLETMLLLITVTWYLAFLHDNAVPSSTKIRVNILTRAMIPVTRRLTQSFCSNVTYPK